MPLSFPPTYTSLKPVFRSEKDIEYTHVRTVGGGEKANPKILYNLQLDRNFYHMKTKFKS